MAMASVSDDGRALLLLCSSVASARGEEARPFGPKGWARLAGRLQEQRLAPAQLVGMTAADLEVVARDAVEAELMARLLARSGQLAFELDRLAARGIGAVTITDEGYPGRLRSRLGTEAPPVLFLAGDETLLEAGGVAIVGSRDVDPIGTEFAQAVAAAAARDGLPVVSGGARGVDQQAMQAAFEAGGRVIGILPEGIERRTREASTRVALADGQAVIASPYHPGAWFTAGAAMGRNKLVYALSDVAIVISSAAESGGTWAGAVEALAGRWVPVFVRQADDMPDGNRRLIDRGGIPLETAQVPEIPSGWAAAGVAPPGRPRSKKQRAAEARASYEQATLDLLDS
jgi:DNA processing protein